MVTKNKEKLIPSYKLNDILSCTTTERRKWIKDGFLIPELYKGEAMKYRYNVYCWIYPQSGFDVRETNMLLNDFKNLVLKVFADKAKALKSLERLLKLGEGKIIDTVTLESDKPITNAEKELFPEIKKIYPEAIFIICFEVPSMTLVDKI